MSGPPQQTSADFNPPDRQLLGFLSMILGDLQIEQLHSLFAGRSTEQILTLARDCRRTCEYISPQFGLTHRLTRTDKLLHSPPPPTRPLTRYSHKSLTPQVSLIGATYMPAAAAPNTPTSTTIPPYRIKTPHFPPYQDTTALRVGCRAKAR
jgi:hypothetical protein